MAGFPHCAALTLPAPRREKVRSFIIKVARFRLYLCFRLWLTLAR